MTAESVGPRLLALASELAFRSDLIALDGPGDYASEEVVFEQVGTYYWIETLFDAHGDEIHRGLCVAPDEATTVVPVPSVPETPETPELPPSLALTGAEVWMLPFGIAGGIFVLAGVLTLWFGRRLAIYRERSGYVREEDRVPGDVESGFDRLGLG